MRTLYVQSGDVYLYSIGVVLLTESSEQRETNKWEGEREKERMNICVSQTRQVTILLLHSNATVLSCERRQQFIII